MAVRDWWEQHACDRSQECPGHPSSWNKVDGGVDCCAGLWDICGPGLKMLKVQNHSAQGQHGGTVVFSRSVWLLCRNLAVGLRTSKEVAAVEQEVNNGRGSGG